MKSEQSEKKNDRVYTYSNDNNGRSNMTTKCNWLIYNTDEAKDVYVVRRKLEKMCDGDLANKHGVNIISGSSMVNAEKTSSLESDDGSNGELLCSTPIISFHLCNYLTRSI